MGKTNIGEVIDGNSLYKTYRGEDRRSVLVELVETWRRRGDLAEILARLGGWTYGEKTVAVYMLGRYESSSLASLCRTELGLPA